MALRTRLSSRREKNRYFCKVIEKGDGGFYHLLRQAVLATENL